MSDIWHGGQIDALALPNGCFISPALSKRRIETVRSNTVYREALEKAGRIAGYVDPALSIARGRVSTENTTALFRQNEKAERLIKERRNEKSDSIIVPA